MRQLSPLTRETIVQSALRLLSHRDFAEITTRSIAQSAEISEATLFRYFTRKEDILEAILSERAQHFFKDLEDVLGLVDSPPERLLAICRRHAAFAAQNRDLIAVMQRAYTQDKGSQCLSNLRLFLGRVQQVVQEGMDRGSFRPHLDTEVVAAAFHSVVAAVMLQERVREPLSSEAFVKRAESFYQLYLRAIQPEA
jgi:TetR/AcrR family fatty acid metabolism transcriptional regulator